MGLDIYVPVASVADGENSSRIAGFVR
jgi:hypothetical protein